MKNWEQRSGVWVETDLGVGIRQLSRISVPGLAQGVVTAEISLTNEDGETVAVVPESAAGSVRIARVKAIPAARIAHLGDAELATLGYL